MQDHPGIFSRLTGAIALANANVIDARTYTTSDGYATPVFWIQDNDGKPFDLSRLNRLKKLIEQTLSGDVIARDALKVRNKLKPRERNFKVPTDITFVDSFLFYTCDALSRKYVVGDVIKHKLIDIVDARSALKTKSVSMDKGWYIKV